MSTDDRWLIQEQERKRKDNPMHERKREERMSIQERERLSMQVTEGEQVQKKRGRKRKCNKKKSDILNDVGSGIPLVHDKALTRCLPMGCHSCENNGGLPCGDKDDDTGNAQLCLSFCNDGRH